MLINHNWKWKFKPTELHHFNWLLNAAPCFPLNASKVNIINDPHVFYDTLCDRFKSAIKRITIASLYIGTGALEHKLMGITKENILNNKQLKCHVLLDYQRGTRGRINSTSLFETYLGDTPDQCTLSLYQTPRIQGVWSRILPSRYNELIGLQHMKLYIADDYVLISGANCSNDYFMKRQDRYVEFNNTELADFYSELIGEISKFSKNKEYDMSEKTIIKDGFTREVNKCILNFLEKWKKKQDSKLNYINDEGINVDTCIFPLIQMGEFDIKQDEEVTKEILASVPMDSNLRIATGYFNLTEQYETLLLNHCKANVSLLMAHPNANGFMGASGPAGGIPNAYTLIARKFWKKVLKSNQTERIKLFEYERHGWTYHAKGLWYYPAGSMVPWMTLVGSANLGERSVRRDLEAQAAIITTSPALQRWVNGDSIRLQFLGHREACRKKRLTLVSRRWAAVSKQSTAITNPPAKRSDYGNTSSWERPISCSGDTPADDELKEEVRKKRQY